MYNRMVKVVYRTHAEWTWLLAQLRERTEGQDLIEYALMAGFVAVSAGALMPGVSTSISKIFSKVGSVMTSSASNS